jgi:hypothetical protein
MNLSERRHPDGRKAPHPVSVASRPPKRAKSRPFAMISIALGLAAAAEDQWQSASALLGLGLILLGWYAGLVKTHRCGGYAPTTADGVCGNAPRGGLLHGCHLHRWWRVKRLLRLEDAENRRDPVEPNEHGAPGRPVEPSGAVTVVKVMVLTEARTTSDKLTLWSTVAGGVTGVLSFLVGLLGLAAQFHLI